MNKNLPDLWDQCYDGPQKRKIAPKEFKKVFCDNCMNAGCVNSKGAGTGWVKRITTQEERLLINPDFADTSDSTFSDIVNMNFENMIQKALAIEISTQKGDWSVPTEQEIGRAAAEMMGVSPPLQKHPVEPEIELTPPEKLVDEVQVTDLKGQTGKIPKAPKLEKTGIYGSAPPPKVDLRETLPEPEPEPVLGSWKVLGDSETVYKVTHHTDESWSCACKAFEYGQGECKHIQDIVRRLQRAPKEEPVPAPPAPPTRPPEAPAGFRPPPQNAAPIYRPPPAPPRAPEGGIMIGGGPAPKPHDPWAVPTQKPTERVIPVGGKVRFKKK